MTGCLQKILLERSAPTPPTYHAPPVPTLVQSAKNAAQKTTKNADPKFTEIAANVQHSQRRAVTARKYHSTDVIKLTLGA